MSTSDDAQHETRTATRSIAAAPDAVFAVLADPRAHADIDGTGWVSEPLDVEPITRVGQRFRMAMYHDQHPDKNYEMTNEIVAFDAPTTIAWRPGAPGEDGTVDFGGWFWRYDLASDDGASTEVTLTYDWSAATPESRRIIDFPPFGAEHLDNSLQHLSEIATDRRD